MPLMKNVHKLLLKSVLISLRLTSASSATVIAIQKKIYRSGMATLIISNEEIRYIMKIVKSLKEFGVLIKGVVRETIENKAKEQKGGFLGMLLNTLAAGLFGTMLADKPKIPG